MISLARSHNLRAGIPVNQENLTLNHDMQVIIDQCTPLLSGEADSAASETSLILRQFSGRQRRIDERRARDSHQPKSTKCCCCCKTI